MKEEEKKMKKLEFFGSFLLVVMISFFVYIFSYTYPQRVSVKSLGSGMVIENPICYQKVIAIGGFKNTYQTMCRERVRWHTGEKAGEEETVEVPFPALKGERVKLYEVTIYPYFFFLPPDKRYEYRRW